MIRYDLLMIRNEKRLNELGYRVIRFKNDEVFNDINGVLAAIAAEFMRE